MKGKQKKNVLSKLNREVKKKTNPILFPNAHNKVNIKFNNSILANNTTRRNNF